ncbi:hypothetical protein [Bosea sp. PAMC 26642]|uniref:hypothetical protein n=1 Tax=Bosea sp. (strain PAMC 26642) TaxID=1792307 RepID=UPI0007705931|nr:hypothetical protein [Bosea sp. PAMC 26642]AMJ63050.1 hypothetical protein AXW83_24575 [Bosea sp. PAMC 26642]
MTKTGVVRLLAALASIAMPSLAAAKGCPGTFLRDSQGYAASEGGAEPTADRRAKGENGVFLYYTTMDSERYYEIKGGDAHKAKAVKLATGCRLPKLRPGGKY